MFIDLFKFFIWLWKWIRGKDNGAGFNSIRREKVRKYDLLHHMIFRRIDMFLTNELEAIKFSDEEFRDLVFRDYLRATWESTRDNLKEYLATYTLDSMAKEQMMETVFELFTKTRAGILKRVEAQGIPKPVVSWLTDHSMPALVAIQGATQMVSDNLDFDTNNKRMKAVLDSWLSLLDTQLAIYRKQFVPLKGEVSGLIYKGKTCK